MSAGRFATVGDLAAATIDVLDERGWCQTYVETGDGRVCLVGAVNVAAYGIPKPGYNHYDTAAVHALSAAVVDVEGLWSTGSPESKAAAAFCWNDDNGRTVEDVKLALKHAAESTEPCPDLTIEASR